MRQIFHAVSQNGRWGLSIVSDSVPDTLLATYSRAQSAAARIPKETPVPGTLRHLGRDGAGHDVYLLTHDEAATTWIMVGDDLEPVAGAVIAAELDLQGHARVTILLLGPDAVVKTYSYRRRRSDVQLYRAGKRQDMSAAVMLALGITHTTDAPDPMPAIPPIGTQLRDALLRSAAETADPNPA